MTIETIERVELPGWAAPWCTDAGRWWTTRKSRLTRAQRDAGCAVTVSADTIEALAELVRLHDELATLADAQASRPDPCAAPELGDSSAGPGT